MGSMLVTGVTGAVGRSLVQLAGKADWEVVGIYHQNETQAEELRQAWPDRGATLRLHRCDLTDAGQVEALLADWPEAYCPDVLVHLAAPKFDVQPIHRVAWEDYERQLEGVLKSLVLLVRPILKRMKRSGGGRIISALSAVVLGVPPRGFASYTTAKYALAGFMRCLAAEYAGRGITANMVSPGPMQTDLLSELPALLTDQMRTSIPGGQWIDPESVARAVFWLAAEAGPEVTGCNVPLTSGLTF